MDAMDRNILTLRLFEGVRTGNRNLVRAATEDGADVEGKDKDSCTPLLLACKGGVDDVIDLLIHAGADVEARDNHGDTGLSLAIRNRHTECAKLLVMAGANVNVENKNETALTIACQQGNVPAVKLLIQASADINAGKTFGSSPMEIAMTWGNFEIIGDLIQHGVLKPRDDKSHTCAYSAILDLLIKAGAKLPSLNRALQVLDNDEDDVPAQESATMFISLAKALKIAPLEIARFAKDAASSSGCVAAAMIESEMLAVAGTGAAAARRAAVKHV